jgi:hypothetical protein
MEQPEQTITQEIPEGKKEVDKEVKEELKESFPDVPFDLDQSVLKYTVEQDGGVISNTFMNPNYPLKGVVDSWYIDWSRLRGCTISANELVLIAPLTIEGEKQMKELLTLENVDSTKVLGIRFRALEDLENAIKVLEGLRKKCLDIPKEGPFSDKEEKKEEVKEEVKEVVTVPV